VQEICSPISALLQRDVNGADTMMIAVASGKGGTGKTTVATNLARVSETEIYLLDCDVEEPNDHLFLKGELKREVKVNMPVPTVDTSLCNGCGECSRLCAFHAIVSIGTHPLVFPELCHGCGGCVKICPTGAISESPREIGTVSTYQADHVVLIEGRLTVGVSLAPPVIRAVRDRIPPGKTVILDAPPGTSCPVVASVRDADILLLVTEPTPFGLNDLKLAIAMARELSVPHGVLINRVGVGDSRVHDYCQGEGISILAEIPDDRRIAETYSTGAMVIDTLPEYRAIFQTLLNDLLTGSFGIRKAT